jgi:hypothetical protein
VAFGMALLLEQFRTGKTAADLLVLAGFVGFVAITLGLILVRAGGGRFGQVALGIWFAGRVFLLAGAAVEAVTANHDNLFYPASGLLTTLGGLLSAVLLARAGVLRGWRAAPALAAYYLFLLVLNMSQGDDWNQPLIELGWPLLAIATAVALLAEPTAPVRPSTT